jgi:hypothetical protein
MHLKPLSSPFTDQIGETMSEFKVWAGRKNEDITLLIKNISICALNLYVFKLKSICILALFSKLIY